jgi:hypothetical protein
LIFAGLCGHLQAKVRRSRRAVAQRARRQFARAPHRMDVRLDGNRHVGHPACGRLVARAVGLVGQGITFAAGRQPGQPRHQGGFGQALQVDDGVVGFLLQPP